MMEHLNQQLFTGGSGLYSDENFQHRRTANSGNRHSES
jgi:hypothetical protein